MNYSFDHEELLFSFEFFVQEILLHDEVIRFVKSNFHPHVQKVDATLQQTQLQNTTTTNTLNETSISSYSLQSSHNTPKGTIIGFRLWDFPLLYIQNAFTRRNNNTIILSYKSGKSCIFKNDFQTVNILLKTQPLYIFIFDMYNGITTNIPIPDMIASTCISLQDLFLPEKQSKKHILSGTYTLKSESGLELGVISCDISLKLISKSQVEAHHLTVNEWTTLGTPIHRPLDLATTNKDLFAVQDVPSQTPTIETIPQQQKTPKPKPKKQEGEITALTRMVAEYTLRKKETQDLKGNIRNILFDLSEKISELSAVMLDEDTSKKTTMKKKVSKKKKLVTEVSKVKSITTPTTHINSDGSKSVKLVLQDEEKTKKKNLPNGKVMTVQTRSSKEVTITRPKSAMSVMNNIEFLNDEKEVSESAEFQNTVIPKPIISASVKKDKKLQVITPATKTETTSFKQTRVISPPKHNRPQTAPNKPKTVIKEKLKEFAEKKHLSIPNVNTTTQSQPITQDEETFPVYVKNPHTQTVTTIVMPAEQPTEQRKEPLIAAVGARKIEPEKLNSARQPTSTATESMEKKATVTEHDHKIETDPSSSFVVPEEKTESVKEVYSYTKPSFFDSIDIEETTELPYVKPSNIETVPATGYSISVEQTIDIDSLIQNTTLPILSGATKSVTFEEDFKDDFDDFTEEQLTTAKRLSSSVVLEGDSQNKHRYSSESVAEEVIEDLS